MDSTKVNRHISELDGLRGIAVLMVIAYHFDGVAMRLPGLCHEVMRFGWTGVDLFFVLSGFLIGGILIGQRDSPHYFMAFYARRFFRIIPLYALIVAIYGIGWLVCLPSHPGFLSCFVEPMPWYTYLTFTSNFWIAEHATMHVFLCVAWSLAIEEQFYLTWPFVVKFVKPRFLPPLTAALVLLVFGARAYLGQSAGTAHDTWYGFYTLPWFRADGLLIGVLCAILVRKEDMRRFLHRRCWLLYALAIGLFTGLCKINMTLPQSPASMQVKYGYTVLALFWAAVLLIAVVRPGPFRVLGVRALRDVGKVAYFLYLTHLSVMVAVLTFVLHLGGSQRFSGPQMLGIFAASFAATFALAQLSWGLFESRMMRIGQRFQFSDPPAAESEEPLASRAASMTVTAP